MGSVAHGVNFCGGLHHAMPGNASGFCIYNDIAVGIQWLLDNGAQRVAYVDVDVHHGDGVERIFWDDPRVLTVSLHETGRAPSGHWLAERHRRALGLGSAVNVAFPPARGTRRGCGRCTRRRCRWCGLQARDPRDPARLRHPRAGPLAHMALSVDAQRAAVEALHRLAHDVCEGLVALGGAATSSSTSPGLDPPHRHRAAPAHRPDRARPGGLAGTRPDAARTPGPAPDGRPRPADGPIWHQPWDMGYNPHSEVDRAIMATRQAVFEHFGLDLWFD